MTYLSDTGGARSEPDRITHDVFVTGSTTDLGGVVAMTCFVSCPAFLTASVIAAHTAGSAETSPCGTGDGPRACFSSREDRSDSWCVICYEHIPAIWQLQGI